MNMGVDRSGAFPVVRLAGELSAADGEKLVAELADLASGEGARLAIDLSNVTWLDSRGLAALIHLVTRSRLSGGRVILVAPGAFVRGVLEVTRLAGWFDICETMEQAEEQLGQP